MIEASVDKYCEEHTSLPSQVLQDLLRETHLKTVAPQMASGHFQGVFLQFLTKMIQPKKVLEIGTFTGYATLCMLEGLAEDGIIHTIEVNPERAYLIEKYIKKAKAEDKIQLHIGDAQEIISTLGEGFDFVFIDAGKMHYPRYFDMVIEKTKKGGYILSDNVLWRGKVVNPKDRDGQILDFFNKKVHQDTRVENILLPIRDGIMIARKL